MIIYYSGGDPGRANTAPEYVFRKQGGGTIMITYHGLLRAGRDKYVKRFASIIRQRKKGAK